MGCKGKKHDGDSCVCEVLRAVADAQDEVDVDNDCDVSCHRSIQELLAGAQTPNGLDTIPLILYCGDCVPFEGFGARVRNGNLDCFRSFFFRVTSVDNDCCAKIELLTTRGDSGNFADPCAQIQTGGARNEFFRTGICITVDLDCFCAVTCLDPVAALPLSSLPGQ
ncbi:CotY/CotZ family spore coat protein [Mesobacillus subterraneus]|uniref:Spore coat protein n=1 Tax=Mesobacillus subterraneus TaxID=285983 RepID=A0A3R9DXD6_9BACI|nr:CotY/CotZ family spore coat protein [Mesobacillus subterraneus]RSD29430.1 spore coat protein [Mesobacillus subterraneus]